MNASLGSAARKNSIFSVPTDTGRRRCATERTCQKAEWDKRGRDEEEKGRDGAV